MVERVTHPELVARIAINSKLTAHEVEEALEVLSVIVQETLQQGGSVDLLGIGTFRSEDKVVSFDAGQSLREVVADPAVNVVIERSPGILPGRTFDPDVHTYKHKVNVNC